MNLKITVTCHNCGHEQTKEISLQRHRTIVCKNCQGEILRIEALGD